MEKLIQKTTTDLIIELLEIYTDEELRNLCVNRIAILKEQIQESLKSSNYSIEVIDFSARDREILKKL